MTVLLIVGILYLLTAVASGLFLLYYVFYKIWNGDA